MQIVVEKQRRRLTVYNDTEIVFSCRAGLGREPVGAKQAEGDGRTPEGRYRICLIKPAGKYGRSLGLSYTQTMRSVIVPQAFKNVLPALGNELIVLLKETSVAGYIALQDLTKGGDIIRSQTYDAFMPLIAVALIYLAVVMLLSYLLGRLERSLKTNE